jgi:uncharacterized OB-fold protein
MTEAGILLEYETSLAADGKPLSTCPECGYKTHRSHCPECTTADGEPLSLSGDSVMDTLMQKIEAGEKVDIEAALRNGEWEPVEFGDRGENVDHG